MNKDRSILELLSRLDLPAHNWRVVDHWDSDMFAIGIGKRSEPRRLVYVSTFKKSSGEYDYECEAPPGPGETDYSITERGENVAYHQLLEALEKHLQ